MGTFLYIIDSTSNAGYECMDTSSKILWLFKIFDLSIGDVSVAYIEIILTMGQFSYKYIRSH